jgi:hypothetical protein
MEITTIKQGSDWIVQFNHDVQYFTLDYKVETKEEAEWMKNMLIKCFDNAFGKNWHEKKGLIKPVVNISTLDVNNHGKIVLKKLYK